MPQQSLKEAINLRNKMLSFQEVIGSIKILEFSESLIDEAITNRSLAPNCEAAQFYKQQLMGHIKENLEQMLEAKSIEAYDIYANNLQRIIEKIEQDAGLIRTVPFAAQMLNMETGFNAVSQLENILKTPAFNQRRQLEPYVNAFRQITRHQEYSVLQLEARIQDLKNQHPSQSTQQLENQLVKEKALFDKLRNHEAKVDKLLTVKLESDFATLIKEIKSSVATYDKNYPKKIRPIEGEALRFLNQCLQVMPATNSTQNERLTNNREAFMARMQGLEETLKDIKRHRGALQDELGSHQFVLMSPEIDKQSSYYTESLHQAKSINAAIEELDNISQSLEQFLTLKTSFLALEETQSQARSLTLKDKSFEMKKSLLQDELIQKARALGVFDSYKARKDLRAQVADLTSSRHNHLEQELSKQKILLDLAWAGLGLGLAITAMIPGMPIIPLLATSGVGMGYGAIALAKDTSEEHMELSYPELGAIDESLLKAMKTLEPKDLKPYLEYHLLEEMQSSLHTLETQAIENTSLTSEYQKFEQLEHYYNVIHAQAPMPPLLDDQQLKPDAYSAAQNTIKQRQATLMKQNPNLRDAVQQAKPCESVFHPQTGLFSKMKRGLSNIKNKLGKISFGKKVGLGLSIAGAILGTAAFISLLLFPPTSAAVIAIAAVTTATAVATMGLVGAKHAQRYFELKSAKKQALVSTEHQLQSLEENLQTKETVSSKVESVKDESESDAPLAKAQPTQNKETADNHATVHPVDSKPEPPENPSGIEPKMR